ncbi:MAG: hypothetical protein R2724_31100 [Bryobacterales bacterium]
MEMLSIAEPMLRGIVTGEWEEFRHLPGRPKAQLLGDWDAATKTINEPGADSA